MTSLRTAVGASIAIGLFMTNSPGVVAQDADARLRVARAQLEAAMQARAQDADVQLVLEPALNLQNGKVELELAMLQVRGGRTGAPAAPAGLGTDPMTGPVVIGSPFSADATTTVVQTLGDGTRIEQRATAKFHRDGTGRVRRELTVIGLDALNPSAEPRTVITFDSEPGNATAYTLDPVNRTARRVARGSLGNAFGVLRIVNTAAVQWFTAQNNLSGAAERLNDALAQKQQLTEAERAELRELERALNVAQSQGLQTAQASIPNGLKPTVEELGTRQMEGVKATGRRTTLIIPTDRVGNDRPMQISDEKWESPELGLVVYSRYSDPRTGVIEYRLTNVRRTEPAADLFQVPADYTVIEPGGRGRGRGAEPVPPPPPGTPGARGSGRGGRSPQ